MQRSILKTSIVGILFGLILSGCGAPKQLTINHENIETSGPVVIAASPDGFQMTARHLFDKLSASLMVMPGGTFDTERSRFLRDSILVDTLAGLAGNDIKLSNDYFELIQYKHMFYDYLLDQYWNRTLYDITSTDSVEVVAFYHENDSLFSIEEQVNLYHILSSPRTLKIGPDSTYFKDATGEQLFSAAEDYILKIKQLLDWGEPFQNVAFQYSHDASSQKDGGYMGWTLREQYLDPFDSIAFSLNPDEYSEPYSDRDGWHILFIDGYLPDGPLSLDSATVFESALQTLLTYKSNQVLEIRLDSLRKSINIKPNEAILNENIHLLDDKVWVCVVNGIDTIDVRTLKQYEEGFRRKYNVDNTTPDQKLEMMLEPAMKLVQVQAARAAGIDTIPAVVTKEQTIKYLRKKAIILKESKDDSWTPEVNSIQAYYDAHIDEYVLDKTIKVEFIGTTDSSFGEFLQTQAESGLDMSEIVADNSGSGYSITHFDMKWVSKSDLSDEVFRLASRTRPGQISSMLKTDDGLFVTLKVWQRRESRTFELARGDIKMKMVRTHRDEIWGNFRDKLFSKYKIIFPVQVEEIGIDNYHVRIKNYE